MWAKFVRRESTIQTKLCEANLDCNKQSETNGRKLADENDYVKRGDNRGKEEGRSDQTSVRRRISSMEGKEIVFSM